MGLDEVEAGDVAEVTVVGGEWALANEGGGGDPGVGGGERSTHASEVAAQAGGDVDKDWVRPDDLVLGDAVSQAQRSCLAPGAGVSPNSSSSRV